MKKCKLCYWVNRTGVAFAALMIHSLGQAVENTDVEVEVELDEIVVEASQDKLPPLTDVTEAQILAGKKVTFVDVTNLPKAPGGNVRNKFSRTPGVYVSEIDNPSIVNL